MTFWILAGAMSVLALFVVIAPMIHPGPRFKPLLVCGLIVMIPLTAVLTYRQLGTPTLATESYDSITQKDDLNQLADKLAEKLRGQPDNADGWALLALTYVELNRNEESLIAFEKAVSLFPENPHVMADYADALVTSNDGNFNEKSENLVERALQLDPLHTKALILKATIAFNRKNYTQAITHWEKLLTAPDLDTEISEQIRGNIEEAQHMMKVEK